MFPQPGKKESCLYVCTVCILCMYVHYICTLCTREPFGCDLSFSQDGHSNRVLKKTQHKSNWSGGSKYDLLSYLSAAYEVTPEEACRDLSIIPSSNTESNQTAFSWPNDSGAFESSPPYHQIPTAKLDFTGVMRKVPKNPVTFVRTCVKKNLRPYPLPKQKPLKTIHVSQAISMSKIVRLISSSCAVNWSLWD